MKKFFLTVISSFFFILSSHAYAERESLRVNPGISYLTTGESRIIYKNKEIFPELHIFRVKNEMVSNGICAYTKKYCDYIEQTCSSGLIRECDNDTYYCECWSR